MAARRPGTKLYYPLRHFTIRNSRTRLRNVTLLPLGIIRRTPVRMSLRQSTINSTVLRTVRHLPSGHRATNVVNNNGTIFNRSRIALRFLYRLTGSIFRYLQVSLMIRLNRFYTLQYQRLPLQTMGNTNVILRARGVVIFSVERVVNRLLLPYNLNGNFTTKLYLRIIRQRNRTRLSLQTSNFSNVPYNYVNARRRRVAFQNTLTSGSLQLKYTRRLYVLRNNVLRIFRRPLRIRTRLRHTLNELSNQYNVLNDPFYRRARPLKSHNGLRTRVNLISNTSVTRLTTRLFRRVNRVAFRVLCNTFNFPTTLTSRPFQTNRIR